MLYVIGQNPCDWLKIKTVKNIFMCNYEDKVCEHIDIEAIIGGPQNKATFFNNKSDAVEMLETMKKQKVKIQPYLPMFDENPTIEDLKIFTLQIQE